MRILVILIACVLMTSVGARGNIQPIAGIATNITAGVIDSINDAFHVANESGAFQPHESDDKNVTLNDIANSIISILNGVEVLTIGIFSNIDQISKIFAKPKVANGTDMQIS